jgi:hypothetical protein
MTNAWQKLDPKTMTASDVLGGLDTEWIAEQVRSGAWKQGQIGTEEDRAAYAVECERHGTTVEELSAVARKAASPAR